MGLLDRVSARVYLPIIALTTGQYSLYFCMDVDTGYARIKDHVMIQGSSSFFHETAISLKNGIYWSELYLT